MLILLSDAAYSRETNKGAYCIVTINNGKKEWYTKTIDCCNSSTIAEYAGVRAAIDIIQRLKKPAVIYCDNLYAIDKIGNEIYNEEYDIPEGCSIRHIRGHQLGQADVPVTELIKAHDWADKMARAHLKTLLRKK